MPSSSPPPEPRRRSAMLWPTAAMVVGAVLVAAVAGCERKVRLRVKVDVADIGTATSSAAER